MASKIKTLEDEYDVVQIVEKYLTDECFMPDSVPRQTQVTYGKYMIRNDGKNDYLNQKINVHPKILDKWAHENRQFWIDKVGTNDYFIHDLFHNTNLFKNNYTPKYYPFKRLFPRPYSCELDSINSLRLRGMKDIENKYRPAVSVLNKMIKEATKKGIGEFEPPFWWEIYKRQAQKLDPCKKEVPEFEEEPKVEQLRWKNLAILNKKTICQRREEMGLVGQPFKHEACTFYYKHFPAPKLKLFQEKFSK